MKWGMVVYLLIGGYLAMKMEAECHKEQKEMSIRQMIACTMIWPVFVIMYLREVVRDHSK